jgi:hypothetical protein
MYDPKRELWSVRHPYAGTFIHLLVDGETGDPYLRIEQGAQRVNVPLVRLRALCEALEAAGADLAGAMAGDDVPGATGDERIEYDDADNPIIIRYGD